MRERRGPRVLRTVHAVRGFRQLAARLDAATPPGRDRALDALRALAILGVVAGHWLVTALVVDSGRLRVASPLRHLPELAPLSWVFQTLALFFLVGGLVGTRGHLRARAEGVPYGRWIAGRAGRLFRPVVAVVALWGVVALAMLAGGAGLESVRALAKLVLSPMWFLLVFAVLTAATPLVSRLHPVWPLAAVACADLVRFGGGVLPGHADAAGDAAWDLVGDVAGLVDVAAGDLARLVNVAAGWLVPYCLGAAWARGRLRGRATGWALLLGGSATAGALVTWGGYPGTMVGVPGAPVSNLDPPSLAAVSWGLAQCGAALLLLGPLRRLLRRPAAWAPVALVNLASMTVFLWHQTAMIAVTSIGLLVAGPPWSGDAGGTLPGLHTPPDGAGWVLARVAWLPAFAVALLVCCATFHVHERGRPRSRGRYMTPLGWTSMRARGTEGEG
ncbi:acyltransferase family protein [Nonomuraea phyllanthi]|uniref:acyltransferase family protein n=1 Tax=Nonomuraea phyllanthi TaxID=2219224 RepID=UPI0012934AD9|nr:acyltransferase [Nonomuraea phyllanthi]QFY12166.1 acyltransferase family protein [Nonomuraea phyllanthi]